MNEPVNASARQRPAPVVAWAAAAAVSALWAVLRLVVFRTIVFPLTYALPLLLCVWTRDKVMLWAMAATYAVLHTIKQFWILPAGALPEWADWATYSATLGDIFVGAAIVHAIIVLRERLEGSLERVAEQSEELSAQNEELAQQSEELTQQNEELSQHSEELSQQAEELTEQSEELSRQNEELQAQTEEIHALNGELVQRERLMQGLLDCIRLSGTEHGAMQQVCRAAVEMTGPPIRAVVVYEAVGDRLYVRGGAGIDETLPLDAGTDQQLFPWLVIQQNRTASLNDVSLRPDLGILQVPGQPAFQAVLAAPLRLEGPAFGAVTIYSSEPREWTEGDYRVAEWLAAQASHILRTLRMNEATRRQAALLDLTPDAIIVRRLDGTVTLWGHGAEALYGWTKEEAIGQSTHALLRTRFPEPLEHIVERLRHTGHWRGELVHTAKDGRERVVESRWLAWFDANGAISEMLESNVDITERKRTEDALREADRRKTEFLATLSHELRNPLAPIRYALQLLDSNDGEASQPKRVIERQLSHLVRLVDDLLDATRVASNKIRLRVARVDLASVVEQAVEACLPEIEQSKHSLSVLLPPDPVWLDADSDRLVQVLVNLLTNAARYTAPGGRIALTCTASDGEVAVSVADTGIGLKEEDLARVFEMFAQVGEPGRGGLGIGLSLVKGLVGLHGGSVEARSAGPGRGAEFLVRLPRAAGARAEASPASATAMANGSSPRRILVVDDNVDSAEMMKTLLELDGHDVEVAHDAMSALARAEAASFEIGLLDIGLPDMSGYQLAERLRANAATRALHLIAVTGWGQEADRARARASGFDDHLTKPADPDRLRAMIAAHTSTPPVRSASPS